MYCDPEKHREHLCSQWGKSSDRTRPLDAAFECGCCGAKAKELDKVCEPVAVSKITWMADGSDLS